MGSASASLGSSTTEGEAYTKLGWFQSTPLWKRCPILLLVSSLLAASSDGETFFGSSVELHWLSHLARLGDAAEPIKYLTERMSWAHLMPYGNNGLARSCAFPAKYFFELALAHLTTDLADSTAGYLLLFAASMSACFIVQSHEHMRHQKENSRNTQLEAENWRWKWGNNPFWRQGAIQWSFAYHLTTPWTSCCYLR